MILFLLFRYRFSNTFVTGRRIFASCLALFFLLPGGTQAQISQPVSGFDGKEFSCKITEQAVESEYSLYRITYLSPTPQEFLNAEGVAYYYRPNNLSPDFPRPGVICLHILGGDGSLTRTIASYLAIQGIPSLMVIMPWFGERAPAGGRRNMNVAALIGALRQTPGDIRRAIDIFAQMPGVDSQKIGLMGTSMGAIFGATVSGMDERIQKAFFLLGGGDLNFILAQPTREAGGFRKAMEKASNAEKREFQKVLSEIDPLNYAGNLRERAQTRKIVMVNAKDDAVIPPSATQKLADAMGLPETQRIWLPDAGHYSALTFLPDILVQLRDFFKDETVLPVSSVPEKRIESILFGQLARLCDFQPGTHIKLEFEGIIANQKQCRGTLSLRRGDGNRFKIEVHLINVPIPIQKFSVGRDDHGILWCSGTRNIVVYGSENLVNEPADELSLPQTLLFSQLQKFFSNIFRIIAQNPSLVKQFAKLSTNQKDCLILKLAKSRIFLQFQLNATGTYPEKLTIKVKGFSGTVTISTWEMQGDISGAVFSPASDSTILKVDANALLRMLSPFLSFSAHHPEKE